MSEINITLSRVGPQGPAGQDGLNGLDAADSVNQSVIALESALGATDVALQNNIDSVNSSLISEVATLEAADTTLQNNIDSANAAIIAAYKAADAVVTTAYQNADSDQTASITAAYVAADATVQSNVDSVNASLISNVSDLETSIGNETTARTNADSDLQAQINALDLGTDSAAVSAIVDSDYVQARETVTSLSLATNTLSYTDEAGATTNLDLSLYLDDTNLARLTSGAIDSNGLATFTRDDATTFTVDFSTLFDDTNLARITSAGFSTGDGVLTLTRDDATTVTVDLDGRFALSSAVPSTTDDLTEGSTNLYYDSDAVVSSFNTQFNAKTTDNLTEGSTNLYYDSDAVVSSFNTQFNAKTTDNLTEGSTNRYYDSDAVDSRIDNKLATFEPTITGAVTNVRTVSNTTYTVDSSDAGALVLMNSASANTITFPANATYNFPEGSVVYVMQRGAGQTTLAVTSGDIYQPATFNEKTAEQYSIVAMVKIEGSSNTWSLQGDLELA